MNDDIITKYDLAAIDRVFARSYNVNFRSLNKNGWNCFCEIWKDKFPKEINDLLKLIVSEEVFKNNKLNKYLILELTTERIEKLLIGNIADSNGTLENSFYNKKILNAIFKVMPDGIDPFYSEIKSNYPVLKNLYRFYYLQLLYRINDPSFNREQILTHPIGYNEKIVAILDNKEYNYSDNNAVILLVSGIWIRKVEKKDLRKEEQAAQAKQYYCCNRTRLCIEDRMYELLNDLKENDRTNKALSFDEEQFLLGQCLSYQVMSLECVDNLINQGRYGYEKILQLLSNSKERQNYNKLGNEDKFRLLSSIPVFLSSECINLLDNNILQLKEHRTWWQIFKKKKNESVQKFEIHFPLAKVGINILQFEYNYTQNDYLFLINQKEDILYTDVYLNSEKNEKLGKELYRLISRSHREDIAKLQAREKATLSLFKHEFEKLLSTNESWNDNAQKAPPQICLSLRHAKRLVLADYALYLEYNSIDRELNCIDAIRNEFLLEIYDESPIEKYRWEEEIVKIDLKNLSVYESGTKYKCCICIREERIISRFEHSNNSEQTLFSNHINQEYGVGAEVKGMEDEADNIFIPIVAHNRKMGVFYLASKHNSTLTHLNSYI
jgi:hypothetical protein